MKNALVALKTFVAVLCAFSVAFSVVACSNQKFSNQPASNEFGQNVVYSKDVDVLWVIDTSESMADHQNRLAEQVESFVTTLDGIGLSYQMGVTTMDMGFGGAKGRFVYAPGTPAILTPATPNLAMVLAGRLKLGEAGSPLERGLQAMKAALTGPNLSTGDNKGFLRKDSLLVVNFLSNEDDTASVSDDYQGFLDQIRPPLPYGDRSWIANFMGVVAHDPTCTTLGQFSSPGLKYIALAETSHGAVESICGGDLRRALSNVRARILEVTTEWPLVRKPLVNTIRVTVNGGEVLQSETNGWTYYEPGNSIRFHGDAVPKQNSRIRVDFDPADAK